MQHILYEHPNDGLGLSAAATKGILEALIEAQRMMEKNAQPRSRDENVEDDETSTLGEGSITYEILRSGSVSNFFPDLPSQRKGDCGVTNDETIQSKSYQLQNHFQRTKKNETSSRSSSVTGAIVSALSEAKSMIDQETRAMSVDDKDEYDDSSILGGASISSEVRRLDTLTMELQQSLSQLEKDFRENVNCKTSGIIRSNEVEVLPTTADVVKTGEISVDRHSSHKHGSSIIENFVQRENRGITTEPSLTKRPLSSFLEPIASKIGRAVTPNLEAHVAQREELKLLEERSIVENESARVETVVPTIMEEYEEQSDHSDTTTTTFGALLEDLEDIKPVFEPNSRPTRGLNHPTRDDTGLHFARSLSVRTAANSLASSNQVTNMQNRNGPARMFPRFLWNRLRRVEAKNSWSVGVPIVGSASMNNGRRMMFFTNTCSAAP